jgi:hypothetical protein
MPAAKRLPLAAQSTKRKGHTAVQPSRHARRRLLGQGMRAARCAHAGAAGAGAILSGGRRAHRRTQTAARRASENVCTQPCVAKTSEKVKPIALSSTRMGTRPTDTSQPPRPYSASSDACTAPLRARRPPRRSACRLRTGRGPGRAHAEAAGGGADRVKRPPQGACAVLLRAWEAVQAHGPGGMLRQRRGHATQARAPGGQWRACSGSPAWPWRAQSPARSGRTAPRTRQSARAPGPRPRTTCAPGAGAPFARTQARPLWALHVRPPRRAGRAALCRAEFISRARLPGRPRHCQRPKAHPCAPRAGRAGHARRARRAGRGRTARW